MIERFGGHAMAAGLTIKRGALASFAERIAAVAERRLAPDALTRKVLTDGMLEPVHMSIAVASLLRDAGPWGQGFPEPMFDGCFELVELSVLKSAHLKLRLKPEGGAETLDAIAFNRAVCDWPLGSRLELAYRLEVNDFLATPRVQLVVEHMRAVS
jgi:single-stranded-DNA-specific exonuclease